MPAYQQNKSSGGIIVALVLSRIVILAGIRRVFFRADPSDAGPNGTETTTRYYVGEQVLLDGTITTSDDIALFSHKLTSSEGMVFGLRSFEISLDEYTGPVQLRGKIVEFKKKIPVIEVSDIIGTTDEEDKSTSTGTTSYRYFSAYELAVDMTNFPGYTLSESNSQIQLVDTAGETVFSIAPFKCVPGDATQDCQVLKNNLQEQQAERFATAEGINFSKFTETNNRYAFNGNKFGYTITASSDDKLQTHAGVMQFLSPTQISTYLEEARVLCRNITTRLASISDHTVTISENGRVEIVIEGTSDADAGATCTVSSQAPEINRFSLVRYDDGGVAQPGEGTGAAEEPDDEEDETPPSTGTTGPVDAPANLASRISYPSVRGRTLYMSKNTVAYQGQLLTGNEQPGCPYQINLYYRNKDTEAVPADGRIFECAPSGVASLESQGYTKVGGTGDTTFMMKQFTTDISGVDYFVQ